MIGDRVVSGGILEVGEMAIVSEHQVAVLPAEYAHAGCQHAVIGQAIGAVHIAEIGFKCIEMFYFQVAHQGFGRGACSLPVIFIIFADIGTVDKQAGAQRQILCAGQLLFVAVSKGQCRAHLQQDRDHDAGHQGDQLPGVVIVFPCF